MLHFLVSQCGALTEAETYSGYTAHQMAMAAEPVLAALLADLGAQTRPCLLEKFSSDDEDNYVDSNLSLAAPWRPQIDKVKKTKNIHKIFLVRRTTNGFLLFSLQNTSLTNEALHLVA